MNINLLIKAASFVPSRLESSDAWTGHIPFAHWLINILNPAAFVELGTYSGNSYLAFCQTVKENNLQTRCYGVDTWKGDVHSGFYNEDIFDSLNRYHSKAYAKFSSLLRMTFDEAVYYFPDHSIDLLHIDGLHTYDAVKHDFETWLPKLTSQAVVIFHDTNVREREFGVWRFWQELCQKYPYHFEFIHSHGLGVLQLASEPIHPELDFLNPDFSFHQLFLDYFASLGQRITDRYHRQELEKTTIDFKQEIDAHQTTLQSVQTQLVDRDAQTAALQTQMVEQEQLVNSLQMQILEYDRLSQSLQTQLTETEQFVQTLQTQLTERTQQIENLQAKVGEHAQQTEALQQKQAEWELQLKSLQTQHSQELEGLRAQNTEELEAWRAQGTQELEALRVRDFRDLETLRAQLTEEVGQETYLKKDLANLKNYANQREQILLDLNNKLLEIYSSTAWKIIQRMWKVRLWLAPKGSWREQFARRIINIRRSKVTGSKTNNLSLQHTEDQSNLPTADIKVEDSLPVISIIIPVYNALTMTKACVESLYLFTEGHDFEVIVIDNASEDGTFQWLNEKSKQLAKLNVIRMEKNIGFGPAVNIGLQSAKGKYLVILNNDTLVSRGWLTNLISVLKNDSSVGIVSPVTNYVGEGPQIDPQAQNLQPTLESVAEYAQTINERSEVYYEPNRLVFFCVLLRRELVDLIGYLDEGYQKGNFEDDDYCLRTRAAGYRLAIARNTFVYHHGTVTFKLNQISHNQWMEINRNRFYQKAGRIATAIRQWTPSSTDPKISVILRTKDRPKLLRKALTSLANQTYRDFEVVLVNDGGEDVSDLVFYFKSYFQITYIRHDSSKGRTAAINAGLQRVQGAWIAYLDDDDILYPWHFESLLKAVDQSSAGVIYGDYNKALFYSTEDNSPELLVGAPPWDYSRQELLVGNYLPIHTYIHLRKFIDELGPWNENLDRLEDYDFLLRLSGVTDFYHLRKVTCEYRYYLDCINTVFNGREGYLTALQQIYPHHPVDEDILLFKRQQVMEGLQYQIKIIDELLQNASTSKTEQMAARREIFRITSGF